MQHQDNPKFLRVRCSDCGNEQFVYSHASTPVKCLACGKTIATSKGGKAEIKTTVIGAAL